MIPILSLTSKAYAEAIQTKLGKGYQHALLIYKEWCRTGKMTGSDPAFKNAAALFDSIVALTDFSLMPLSENLTDGKTGKFLLKTTDKLTVETVMIPMQAGGTLCVSSQVGCRMGCAFCETGRMGLLRHLKAEEIVAQFFIARHTFGFSARNIVFMGMGEPFDNYDEVMRAVRILSDSFGFSVGINHITISTSGCLEGIERLSNEPSPIPNLAFSLNAPTDELRNRLMPINRKHPMPEIYSALNQFCKKTGKEVLVAYVLLKEKNDSLTHAQQLADFLQGLPVKINLIPYNPQSRDRFQPPEQIVLEEFTTYLRNRGYKTLLRQTKGQKIMAACGQLGKRVS